MPPLAQAFVRLRSDSSMLAADVRRDAERAGTVGGTAMGRSFSASLRRTAGVVAGLGLTTFAVEAGRYAIDMADKFELSRSRIETVTKNIGGNVESVDSQVQALDERMAAFGFTNADVEGSVASLTSATKNTAKAMKDTALAVDIARGRNISLDSATQILMRVETGHVAMLSRLGIATKDANGHLLTQREALQQLAQVYGGSASHFADTFAGKQAALRAELGNSAAEIGAALLPAAADLARVLQHDVLPPIISATHWFDKNRRTIEPLVGVVLKLYAAYKLLGLVNRVAGGLRSPGGAAAGVEGAYSMGRPLPVFVVNNGVGGGVLGKTATEAESAAVGEAGLRSRLGSLLPKLGRNVLRGFVIETVAQALGGIVGGAPGHAISTIGKGAAVGSVFGPEGTLIGGGVTAAGIGVNKGLNSLQNSVAPSNAMSGVVRQLLANGQGQANLAKLQQIAANQQAASGHVSRTVQLEITQLKAALSATNAKTLADKRETTAENSAANATSHHTRTLQQNVKALHDAQSKSLALSGSQDALRSAIHNLATTASQGGRALAGNSDAALANRDALRGAVQAGESYVQTLKAQHVGAAQVRAAELAVAKAILGNAKATYGNRDAVIAMLKELHFLPGQVQATLSDTYAIGYNAMLNVAQGFVAAGYAAQTAVALESASLNKQLRLGLGADGGGGQQATFVAPAPVHLNYMNVGASLGGDFSQGYSSTVVPGTAKATKNAAKQAMQTARSEMRSFFAQIKSDIASEKSSLISTFASLSTSATTDSLGAEGPPKPFLAQLRSDANQMSTFTRLWLRLDNKHLDPRLLAQFEGLGPAAIPTMRMWLSHPRMIRQANRLEHRIGRDANRVATRDVADASNRDIVRELQKLPRKLALAQRHEFQHIGIHISLKEIDRKNGRGVKSS